MTFTEEELHHFHTKALNECYLGNFHEVKVAEALVERSGFFELAFEEGDWSYRDSFSGFYISAGQEIIRYKGIPVWASSYRGGVTEEHYGNKEFFNQVESFLRKSLAQESDDTTFRPRGPENVVDDEWEYRCEWSGVMGQFKGREVILYQSKEVFYHEFFGGGIVGVDYEK